MPSQRGFQPKAEGSPSTLAKRARKAQTRSEQRRRKAAGEARPAGRRRLYLDASPRKEAARERARVSYLLRKVIKMETSPVHDQPSIGMADSTPAPEQLGSQKTSSEFSPPRPAKRQASTPPSGGFHPTACLICFTSGCEEYMPCGARIHRSCLASWQSAKDRGRQPRGPRRDEQLDDGEGRSSERAWVAKTLSLTKACPHCRGPVGSVRVLLNEPPLPGQSCGGGGVAAAS